MDASTPSLGLRTSRGLERCPVCDYPLKGLPSTHRCPECGFEYDPSTRVWKLSGFRLGGGFGLVLGLILLPVLLARTFTLAGSSPRSWTMVAFALAWAVLVVRRICAGGRLFLATTPSGVIGRLGAAEPFHIPWSQIAEVRIRPVAERAFVRLVRSNGKAVELSAVLGDINDAEAFRAAVGEHTIPIHQAQTARPSL